MAKDRRAQPLSAPTGATTRRVAEPAAEFNVAEQLVRLARLIEGIHAQVSQAHDLTPVQAKLLCILVFAPRTMGQLAQGVGVEKAAMTGLIDRAERRGLVTREPVPSDRRAVKVTLTDAGRRTGQAFHAQVTARLDELVAPLAPRDRAQFARALSHILMAAPAGRSSAPPEAQEAS